MSLIKDFFAARISLSVRNADRTSILQIITVITDFANQFLRIPHYYSARLSYRLNFVVGKCTMNFEYA